MEDRDRWLSDGNCDYCRKEKYCSKDCTARKRAKREIMRQILMKYLKSNNEEEKDEVNE